MAQFRKATTDLRRTIETEIALEEDPPRQMARSVRPVRAVSTEVQLPGSQDPAPGPVQNAGVPVEVLPAPATDPGKNPPS